MESEMQEFNPCFQVVNIMLPQSSAQREDLLITMCFTELILIDVSVTQRQVMGAIVSFLPQLPSVYL